MKTAKEALDCLKDYFEVKTLSKNIQWYRKLMNAKPSSNTVLADHISSLRTVSRFLKVLSDPVKECLVITWSNTRNQVMSEYSRKKEEKGISDTKGSDAGHDLELVEEDIQVNHVVDSQVQLRNDGDSRNQKKKKKKKKKQKKKYETLESNHVSEDDDKTVKVQVSD